MKNYLLAFLCLVSCFSCSDDSIEQNQIINGNETATNRNSMVSSDFFDYDYLHDILNIGLEDREPYSFVTYVKNEIESSIDQSTFYQDLANRQILPCWKCAEDEIFDFENFYIPFYNLTNGDLEGVLVAQESDGIENFIYLRSELVQELPSNSDFQYIDYWKGIFNYFTLPLDFERDEIFATPRTSRCVPEEFFSDCICENPGLSNSKCKKVYEKFSDGAPDYTKWIGCSGSCGSTDGNPGGGHDLPEDWYDIPDGPGQCYFCGGNQTDPHDDNSEIQPPGSTDETWNCDAAAIMWIIGPSMCNPPGNTPIGGIGDPIGGGCEGVPDQDVIDLLDDAENLAECVNVQGESIEDVLASIYLAASYNDQGATDGSQGAEPFQTLFGNNCVNMTPGAVTNMATAATLLMYLINASVGMENEFAEAIDEFVCGGSCDQAISSFESTYGFSLTQNQKDLIQNGVSGCGGSSFVDEAKNILVDNYLALHPTFNDHINNFLSDNLNSQDAKDHVDEQVFNMIADAEYEALVNASFNFSGVMWSIAKELIGDKAVDLIINLIPGFGNVDELRDAIKAAKNGDWLEFTFEVGKIVTQNTPVGKLLKIGESGSQMYIFAKKVEKLWDKIDGYADDIVEEMWDLLKHYGDEIRTNSKLVEGFLKALQRGLKSIDEVMDAIPNFPQMTSSKMKHILHGDESGGLHHISGFMNGAENEIKNIIVTPNKKGVYKIEYKYKDLNDNWVEKISTMFPDSKSEISVAKSIEFVFNNPTSEVLIENGTKILISGVDSQNIPIEIITHLDYSIISSYPIFN